MNTPPSEVKIRPVCLEDAEDINLVRRSPSVLQRTKALPSERVADNQAFLASLGPDHHLFVAEVEGRVVGLAGLIVGRGRERHLASLGISIRDEYQGQGIGRRLMETLLDLADRFLRLTRVELEVLAFNANAIHLYESLGFEMEGRRRQAIIVEGDFVDVFVMGRLRGAAQFAAGAGGGDAV